jgi:hypothetical protein
MGAVGIVSAIVWVIFSVSLIMPSRLGFLIPIFERLEYSWKLQLLLLRHGCLFALGVYLWLLL